MLISWKGFSGNINGLNSVFKKGWKCNSNKD